MNLKLQRQITVAIENERGRLAAVAKALGARGINIKDISVLDTIEQGVIRMVTSDAAGCKAVLQELGFHPIEADVVVVDLHDTPGKMAELADALAKGGVNIDYAYGSEDSTEHKKMRIVLKLSPMERACEIIKQFEAR